MPHWKNESDSEEPQARPAGDVWRRAVCFLDVAYRAVFGWFRLVGLLYRCFLHGVRKRLRRFYKKHLQKYAFHLGQLWLRVVKFFSRFRRFLLYELYLFLCFFVDAWTVVRDGYRLHPKRGLAARLGFAFLAFCRGVRNNARIFSTFFNYAVPVVTAVLFFNLVGYVWQLNFIVDVKYNGEHIGYIKEETVFDAAETALQNRILYQQGDKTLNQLPTFAVTIAGREELSQAAQLTDAMMQLSNDDIISAMGIWVDNKFYGAVRDGSAIEGMLQDHLNAYATPEDSVKPSFTKSIVLERGFYLQNNIVDEQAVVTELSAMEEQDVYDTIQAGDAPSLIAQRNDMTLDELVALNPGILEDCQVGHTVKVHSSKPFLPVKVTRRVTYTESIPYATNKTPSANLWEGTQQVTTAGAEGQRSVTADVSYVDGAEVSRTIVESAVTREPVTQQVSYGTKAMPKVVSGMPTSSYGLIWPSQQSNSYVSDYFGGSRGHRGIDIAFRGKSGYGSPVLASLPGRVIFAGWDGTYGNLVQIDHGNGMITYYAHNSKLQVSVGQTVAQGQVIANVGSTGRSTGNHIHFEVYVNGVRKNPLNYLP